MNYSQCLYFPVAEFPISRGLMISSWIAIGLNILLAISATVGNNLVIVAICRTRELCTKSNILIVFLAMTDLFVGALVQPLFITFELMTILKVTTNCIVVVIFTLSRVLCTILSLVTVLLISFERSLVIFMPLNYSTMVSKRRLILLVSILWVFWALIVTSRLIGLETRSFRILVSVIIIICHISTGLAYVRIQRLSSKHLQNIKAQFKRADNRSTFSRHFSENKALRTTAVITSCVFVCYAPLVGVLLANISMRIGPSTSHVMFTWADTMVFLNSALNPFIYCLRSAEFRRGVAKLLRIKLGADDNNLERNVSRSTPLEIAVSQITLASPVLLSMRYLNDDSPSAR